MSTETNGNPTYDYAIIGSGAGGGPLAANLAKAGKKVLLLEAGGDPSNYHYHVPVFHGLATEDPEMKWDYFVRHYSDDAQQRRDSKFTPERDGVLYPRAGTLGGCTSHNAMITIYGHNSDWDAIAQLMGDDSWKSDNMRKYFERLEQCQYARRPGTYSSNPLLAFFERLRNLFGGDSGNPSRHGYDGWLTTNTADPKLIIKDERLVKVVFSAAAQALVENIGRPLERIETRFDPNDWRVINSNPEGITVTPLATSGGKRRSVRDCIRAVQEKFPDNLIVKTKALVTRVLFDAENKAIGVEYLDGEHLYRADPQAPSGGGTDPGDAIKRTIYVNKEVIISAGAFNTPQLLKLSGIGPREELEKHGIEVRVDLPGVGENLQDRYEVCVITEMEKDFEILEKATFMPPAEGEPGDPYFIEWQSGKGLYTTNGAVIGVIKRSDPSRPDPDLFIFGLPGFFKGYYPGYSKELERGRNFFSWAILKAHTRNTAGRVTLKSADPRDVPHIEFRYFNEGNDVNGEDLDSVAAGVEFVRRMNKYIRLIAKREVLPGENIKTPEQIKEFIRNEAWGHHASCTCKIGPKDDPMAVLDSRFRVYGTKNLRVVDASVFPRIPGFFIVTPIYMISEKASDVILEDG
ncbi:MAG TPA: GMC oxidoreductase [Blastocatellia bacterium]|nr:GMC oxidoreductase [Blastocatellia bacterium]